MIINQKDYNIFGCPVYALNRNLQEGKSHGKWLKAVLHHHTSHIMSSRECEEILTSMYYIHCRGIHDALEVEKCTITHCDDSILTVDILFIFCCHFFSRATL